MEIIYTNSDEKFKKIVVEKPYKFSCCNREWNSAIDYSMCILCGKLAELKGEKDENNL